MPHCPSIIVFGASPHRPNFGACKQLAAEVVAAEAPCSAPPCALGTPQVRHVTNLLGCPQAAHQPRPLARAQHPGGLRCRVEPAAAPSFTVPCLPPLPCPSAYSPPPVATALWPSPASLSSTSSSACRKPPAWRRWSRWAVRSLSALLGALRFLRLLRRQGDRHGSLVRVTASAQACPTTLPGPGPAAQAGEEFCSKSWAQVQAERPGELMLEDYCFRCPPSLFAAGRDHQQSAACPRLRFDACSSSHVFSMLLLVQP